MAPPIAPEMTITAIQNPLAKYRDHYVFGQTTNGGLDLFSRSPLFGSPGDGFESLALPTLRPSSLTSVVFRKMICVFGVVKEAADNAESATYLALLSPIYQRLTNIKTSKKQRCISSATSSDGQDCWIYYVNDEEKISELSLRDPKTPKVVEPCKCNSPAWTLHESSDLAAFVNSDGDRHVIFQSCDKQLKIINMSQDPKLVIMKETPCKNTKIAVTVTWFGGVEMVHVYFIAEGGVLKKIHQRNCVWRETAIRTRANFENHHFTVLPCAEEEANYIYYLDGVGKQDVIVDRYV
ncbi:hypothetical protein Q9L58_009741 [Maublancomyces gigas]|uniref:Uncharacterized protein n=1 Tax=Discina gigas TaxID=1032678 RepID=A0ABR3G6A9_9PEZI